jgi:riboflavin synthase
MFTGLIKDVGTIAKVSSNKEGREFTITTKLAKNIQVDDSIATNGVCLTATKVSENSFNAQAVHITLEKTSLGKLKTNDAVNLELALLPTDRLGGHFVQGHVSGTATFKSVKNTGKNFELTFEINDQKLLKYMILEGSIAIEGISLTIARLSGANLTVTIIPHTWEQTNLSTKKIGDVVNIEVDMMAKYLENFMKFSNINSDERLKNLIGNMHA